MSVRVALGKRVASQPKRNRGKSRRLLAKMMGMTPDWFTRRGRYWRLPPKTRRPRTCLALWVGMRRCPWLMNTTPTTTPTKSRTSTSDLFRAHLAADLGAALDHGLEQLAASLRHAGENAGHDQQADAVADAVLVDLLAQPHEEDRAGGHGEHHRQLPTEGQVLVAGIAHEEPRADVVVWAKVAMYPQLCPRHNSTVA